MTTATLPAAGLWRDNKRYWWLLGSVAAAFPLIGYAGHLAFGGVLWWWFSPIVVYAVFPLLDYLVGEDNSNPPEERVDSLMKEGYYRLAVMLAIPVQLTTFVWGSWMWVHGGLGGWELAGLLLSVGMVSGLAINTAHELGHQTDPLERFLAKLSLAPGAYGHFYVEHNRGHHIRVATPEDPATSRFGESFYEFFPRCVIGSFRSAWQIEQRRLQREGKSVWHWSNDNLQAWAMTVAIWGGLLAWLGWTVLPFLVLQAVYGGSLLEVVNYLEHYGLCRQKKADGRYERCQPHHSWNSNHVITNVFLYHLQRHSDHHANPTRSYQALRDFSDVPRLPSGYSAMILLAYFPPLWFKVMNPRVVAHFGGDMRQANIKPSIREQVIARYSPAASA
ncbi:MAG TPA: alkane 1-monooxygenase [Nevskiaceae bacterium]|nr:alkane 1-monooxygenase [Nevskiaceae bacterium]